MISKIKSLLSKLLYGILAKRAFKEYLKTNNLNNIKEAIILYIMSKGGPSYDNIYFTDVETAVSLSNTVNLVNKDMDDFIVKDDNGNRVSGGATICRDDGTIDIFFSVDIIDKELSILKTKLEGVRDKDLYFALKVLVDHELYHVTQLRYIYCKYGYEGVTKIMDKEKEYEYGKGPLESGAIQYSIEGIKQNFTESFNL
jgi:hypothetical protein